MFGHRYFGARYYGPRYFGDGGPVAVEKSASDTLLVRLDDVLATLSASVTATDTLLPKITEASAISAVLSTSDSILVLLNTATNIAAVLNASDTLLPKLTEGDSSIVNAITLSDTLTIDISDTLKLFVIPATPMPPGRDTLVVQRDPPALRVARQDRQRTTALSDNPVLIVPRDRTTLH